MPLGIPRVLDVSLRNDGLLPLRIAGAVVDLRDVELVSWPREIAPAGSAHARLRVTPSASARGALVLETNDDRGARVEVPITYDAIARPCALLHPAHGQTAAFLVDHVLHDVPLRPWVISPPLLLVPLIGARPEVLGALNRIFVATISRWVETQVRGRGYAVARTGAVTFIQRFSRSLLHYGHLHVVVLDGAYVERTDGTLAFEATRAPTEPEMVTLAGVVARRLGRYLVQRGYIDTDDAPARPTPLLRWYAALMGEPPGYAELDADVGVEPHKRGARRRSTSTGEAQGFSVHAQVTVSAGDKAARERLCRSAARPPLADAHVSMTRDGRVAVQLRARRRGGCRDQPHELHATSSRPRA